MLVAKTADAFRDVYCWQTINCLELWARLLAAHADKQVCGLLTAYCCCGQIVPLLSRSCMHDTSIVATTDAERL